MVITREIFLTNRYGRTFSDVANAESLDFDAVLKFFNDTKRQVRMEDAEIHHDRPPLAGVIREFESQTEVAKYLATEHPQKTKRFRQAVGVIVRIVMEGRGWNKTGRKGSLGVRANITGNTDRPGSYHNTGGLAFWFLRAERYERKEGMPFPSVRQLCKQFELEQKETTSKPSASNRSKRRAT